MPRYKYVGTEIINNLAGVGRVHPDDVFALNVVQAAAIEKNDPDNFKLVPDETPLVSAGVVEEEGGATEPGTEPAANGEPTAPTEPQPPADGGQTEKKQGKKSDKKAAIPSKG